MLSGSLLIQGPPVISGASWPMRGPLSAMVTRGDSGTPPRAVIATIATTIRDWPALLPPPIMGSAWGGRGPPCFSGAAHRSNRGRTDWMSDDRKLAMFIDFENIVRGVKEAQYKAFEIKLVLERLVEKGKIMVKRAYADWSRYQEYKRPFHEH